MSNWTEVVRDRAVDLHRWVDQEFSGNLKPGKGFSYEQAIELALDYNPDLLSVAVDDQWGG